MSPMPPMRVRNKCDLSIQTLFTSHCRLEYLIRDAFLCLSLPFYFQVSLSSHFSVLTHLVLLHRVGKHWDGAALADSDSAIEKNAKIRTHSFTLIVVGHHKVPKYFYSFLVATQIFSRLTHSAVSSSRPVTYAFDAHQLREGNIVARWRTFEMEL